MEPEEIVRRLSVAIRSRAIYAPSHSIVRQSTEALLSALPAATSQLIIGFLDGEVIVNDFRLPKTNAAVTALMGEMREHGVEKISFSPGVTESDILCLLEELGDKKAERSLATRMIRRGVTRISLGKLAIDEPPAERVGAAGAQEIFSEASASAASLWHQANAGDLPSPAHARVIVEGLARLVQKDRAAFMATVALKRHDDLIFTHMVNVAGLSMALARSLNIEGALLHDFGLAALMHDIGKINTPPEILNKSDKLTKQEFEILKRHVVDGAHILRRTPEMPALAPIVAFEHHLGMDFSGYPESVAPRSLNLCTMVVTIVNEFDGLRREPQYRGALVTDRIKAMMRQQDGTRFNRTLLRRFVNLVGLFPTGSLVLSNTEELAVVTRQHPHDPFRPQVKLIRNLRGETAEGNVLANTWERDSRGEFPLAIVEAIDPQKQGIDPLSFIENVGDTDR